ncbi:MAG: tRNA pseudouridine(38-40) synthase TruA [Simkaniaceae bacterium]|nr:tRNA pseudouridine(38-40) synthase TruA [Simkaniaceae bacterium]
MRNVVLHLSYDGSDFLGWQGSIEKVLSQVLERVLQHAVVLQAASRTDKGVHARGQVVNFFSDKDLSIAKLMGSLNGLLPPSIRVIKGEFAKENFHPTIDAKGKVYIYRISNGRVQMPKERRDHWHIPLPLDLSEMKTSAQKLIGTHDFSAFTNACPKPSESTLREITKITIKPNQIIIEGRSFLYKMVRNIVGTLVAIGQGEISPNDLEKILANGDRKGAAMTAPAHGLTLEQVLY